MNIQKLTSWISENRDRCIENIQINYKVSPQGAEDIFQNQCIVAFRHIDDGFSYFDKWFTIGLYQCAMNYRRVSIRHMMGTSAFDFEGSGGLTPEDVMLNEEVSLQLGKSIEKLPPIRKKAIKDYYLNEIRLLEKDKGYYTHKTHRRLGIIDLKKYMASVGDMCYPNHYLEVKKEY